jgi:hypothetical protein
VLLIWPRFETILKGSDQLSLKAGDASAQAMVSSEQQLGWLGQPGEGAAIFEKGP